MEGHVIGKTEKMAFRNFNSRSSVSRSRQRGFSILEMVIATGVLMVGIIAVVQLVPASLQSNLNNRVDTTATVIAQREFDQIISQPLTALTFNDKDLQSISLGNPSTPGVVVGSPIIPGSPATINFTAAPVSQYNIQYPDLNDATGAIYELRWAVITNASNGVITSKRYVLGCRRINTPNAGVFPANLDTTVYAF
jgi:type II secretory pathway pseudopilin PulG